MGALCAGLKTIEDALEIRRRVLLAFRTGGAPGRKRKETSIQLNFVVVGGGPTGVELAGTLAEILARFWPTNSAPSIPSENQDRVARRRPARSACLSGRSFRAARKNSCDSLGVQVQTSAMVTASIAGIGSDRDNRLPAAVILWAAGVAASPLGKKLGAPVDRAGRVLVNPDLSIPGHPEVFVIGDLAALKDENGKWIPGRRPVAIQEGKATAHNIGRELQGEPRKNFHYWNKGTLATIGRAAAVADFGKIHISAFWPGCPGCSSTSFF